MHIFQKGKTYYLDFYVDGQRKRESAGFSKKVAEVLAAKRIAEIAEGKYLDVRKSKKTKFAEFCNEYLEKYAKVNKRSWTRDRTSINVLRPFFGNRRLSQITPRLIEDYKIHREKSVCKATVNRELACLRRIFSIAMDWGKASDTPFKGKAVKFFKEEKFRLRFLTKEEIARLLISCEETPKAAHLKPIVVLALNTGMRKGEILNLTWDQIDFENRIITLTRTKTNEERHIPMNDSLISTLENIKNSYVRSDLVFGRTPEKPFLDVRRSFTAALKRASISNFRFHDLRHTFASHLVMGGVDLRTVMELLGHRDIKMTLKYAHLSPEHQLDSVEMLGKRIMPEEGN